MERIDIKYIIKKLWVEIVAIVAFFAIFFSLFFLYKHDIEQYGKPCPVCHEIQLQFYTNKITDEILGCNSCVGKQSVVEIVE